MVIGINYPWVGCGHDFGHPVVGINWRAWTHAHRNELPSDFRALKALGIDLVRFWVLAAGLNYPDGVAIAPSHAQSELRNGHIAIRRDVDPPRLSTVFLSDFEELLSACAAAELQIIPSFLSYEWCAAAQPPNGTDLPLDPALAINRGRREYLSSEEFARADPPRPPTMIRPMQHPGPSVCEKFLEATLIPLLETSTTYQDHIFAWEVINEPDWAVEGGNLHPDFLGDRMAVEWMRHFLDRSITAITSHGFDVTIGFKEAFPGWLGPELTTRLESLARLAPLMGRYIHQLHHYPSVLERATEPPEYTAVLTRPCMIGEFPSGQPESLSTDLNWPNDDPHRYLYDRLALIERRGFPIALLWSARGGSGDSGPQRGRDVWLSSQKHQVRRYAHGLEAGDTEGGAVLHP